MDDMRRERLGRLLEQALELPASERPGFLARACADDAPMRDELTSLVAAHASGAEYIERLAGQLAPILAAAGGTRADEIAIGQTVSHYEILERIGSGGMGVVYKAHDLRLGRAVALKFLSSRLMGDDAARARLLAEARAASTLDHPNIAVVHEIGETESGGLFIAMAWYAGETLRERLQRGALPIVEAVTIAMQIAGALHAAHEAGIIHRDVKPSNILITRSGVARLVDFGIAKVDGSELTAEGTTLGTVGYMSPEQTRGEPVDARTDIWSIGVVLHEMLAGKRPFRGDSDAAVIHAIRNDAPEPIASIRAETPSELGAIVECCLAKEPSARYASVDDLATDLRAFALASAEGPAAAGRQMSRRPVTTAQRRPRQLAQRPLTWIATAAIGILAVAGMAYRAATDARGPALDAERVMVVPFENRTGEPGLDPVGIMTADWLIQGLTSSGMGDVVPMTTAVAAAGFVDGAAEGRGSADRAARLAYETRAGIVVTGAYYLQGDSLYLRGTVTDVGRGAVLHDLPPIATLASVPRTGIDDLRQQLLGALVPRLNPRTRDQVAVIAAAPPSYESYLAYAEGLELFVAGRFREAIPHLMTAAERDSTFTHPLIYAGIAQSNTGNLAAVDSVLQRVRPRLQAMTVIDRAAFDMLDALVRGDHAAAYRAHLRNPQDVPGTLAHWGRGNAALPMNLPREALRIFRDLDPERGELRGWILYWRDLTDAHHRLGEHRAELAVARRARARFPGNAAIVDLEIRALVALGRTKELDALLREQLDLSPEPALLLRRTGMELRAHGAEDAAMAVLQRSLDWYRDRPAQDVGYRLALATASYLVGDIDTAERLYRPIAAERPQSIDIHGMLGAMAARRGDVHEARRLSDWLASTERPYLRGTHTYWRARIAALLGENEEAVQLLRQAWQEGHYLWRPLHTEHDFAGLRDYPPFQEFIRPKG